MIRTLQLVATIAVSWTLIVFTADHEPFCDLPPDEATWYLALSLLLLTALCVCVRDLARFRDDRLSVITLILCGITFPWLVLVLLEFVEALLHATPCP